MSTEDHPESMERLGELLMDYLPRLVRLADANMSGRIKQRVDPDELANSVLGSMVRMHAQGKLPVSLDDPEDFGALITTIALNKIRKKVRFHRQQKRDVYLEVVPQDDGPALADMLEQEGAPTEADGERLARVLERLEQSLNDEGRIVLAGKRDQLMAEEIARQLNGGKGRSTKTVQRIWKAILQEAEVLADELDE